MLPKQKTTLKEKYAPVNADIDPDYNWFHQTADHYIDYFGYDNQLEEITMIQNAVEGIIDTSQYSYLLNPFNMKNGEDLKVGARLRNHNILKGVAYLMVGEYSRRTHDYSVTALNPEDDNTYKEGLQKQLRDYYEQATINSLNEAGVPTGQDSKEQGTPEEVEAGYKASYDSERVMFGQTAIDYVRFNEDVDDKAVEIYYDWVTVGFGYSYKGILNNDVAYEYVPVEEIFSPFESHSKYVEDKSFVIRRRVLNLATIMDTYGDFISEKDINRLEKEYADDYGFFMTSKNVKTGPRGMIVLPTLNSSQDHIVSDSKNFNGIPVYHTQWRAFEKYGILTYIDELGQEATVEVDDTYKKNEELGDISIEWKWDVCICESIRIADDIHCFSRIVEESRGRLGERGKKKLNYNGISQRSKSGEIQSFAKDGLPYQILINGLHYQLEKVINKSKGKITVMPYGLIPRKKGMTTKEVMYHADATSILWVDETVPNAALGAQMIKTLDMELGSYIRDIYDLIKAIKQEFWDAIGMNAQRYSDIDSGSGKGVTEQAIVRSAIITYDINRQMDKFLEKDYAGILDLSKLAWLNGKKSKYILSDGSQAFLELNADESLYHAESEYTVFVRDSTELSEGMQQLKGVIGQAAQQSGSLTAIAEVVTNTNPEKLKKILGNIEANNKKHEQVLAQSQGESNEKVQEMVNADKEAEREMDKYKADRAYDAVVYASDKKSEYNSRNEPRPENATELMMAGHTINKDIDKSMKENRALDQKDKEIKQKDKQLEIQKSKANGKQ